jgi:hypothetical protein
MKLQQDGDFEVSQNETITVEIEATDTAFLAHTGPIQLGQWMSITRVSPTKEVREFKVTPLFSTNFSFTIGFDFSLQEGKIPATAQYTLRITGTGSGGFNRPRNIKPTSILPTTRVITFEVGQG